MEISYTARFVRLFAKLSPALQEEAKEAIRAFAHSKNHPRLHVHKLRGRLAGRYAFSVNYKYRIIFLYEKSDGVILMAIGDHDVYSEK